MSRKSLGCGGTSAFVLPCLLLVVGCYPTPVTPTPTAPEPTVEPTATIDPRLADADYHRCYTNISYTVLDLMDRLIDIETDLDTMCPEIDYWLTGFDDLWGRHLECPMPNSPTLLRAKDSADKALESFALAIFFVEQYCDPESTFPELHAIGMYQAVATSAFHLGRVDELIESYAQATD